MSIREIFVSDIHFPFHDKAAWNIALKVAQYRQPDIFHIGGDAVDFHSISRHPKQMADRSLLKFEVEESRIELARIRAAVPNAKVTFQEGNHDRRMSDFLRDRSPELSDLFELSFPNLLKLEDVGIGWMSEHEKYRIGKLWHHHGHLIAGGGRSPAKAKYQNTYANLIFGHHHTFDYFSVRQYGTGELIQTLANACLYTLSPEYAHQTHWHIGFTEVTYAESGDFSANQVQVHKRDDGSSYAIVDGYTFESSDEEDIDKYLKAAARRIALRGTQSKSSK